MSQNNNQSTLEKLLEYQNNKEEIINYLEEELILSNEQLDNTTNALLIILNDISNLIEKDELSSEEVSNTLFDIFNVTGLALSEVDVSESYSAEEILEGKLKFFEYANTECDCPKCREKQSEPDINNFLTNIL